MHAVLRSAAERKVRVPLRLWILPSAEASLRNTHRRTCNAQRLLNLKSRLVHCQPMREGRGVVPLGAGRLALLKSVNVSPSPRTSHVLTAAQETTAQETNLALPIERVYKTGVNSLVMGGESTFSLCSNQGTHWTHQCAQVRTTTCRLFRTRVRRSGAAMGSKWLRHCFLLGPVVSSMLSKRASSPVVYPSPRGRRL